MRVLLLTTEQHEHLLGLAVDEFNCAIKHGDEEQRVDRLREIVALIDNAMEYDNVDIRLPK